MTSINWNILPLSKKRTSFHIQNLSFEVFSNYSTIPNKNEIQRFTFFLGEIEKNLENEVQCREKKFRIDIIYDVELYRLLLNYDKSTTLVPEMELMRARVLFKSTTDIIQTILDPISRLRILKIFPVHIILLYGKCRIAIITDNSKSLARWHEFIQDLLFHILPPQLVPIHAAGCVYQDKGILIMGPRNAGKSTFLTCFLPDIEIISDDMVWVTPQRRMLGYTNYIKIKLKTFKTLFPQLCNYKKHKQLEVVFSLQKISSIFKEEILQSSSHILNMIYFPHFYKHMNKIRFRKVFKNYIKSCIVPKIDRLCWYCMPVLGHDPVRVEEAFEYYESMLLRLDPVWIKQQLSSTPSYEIYYDDNSLSELRSIFNRIIRNLF